MPDATTSKSNPYSAYRQASVATAPREKLLLMLYDGAIRFLNQARLSMEQHNIEAANKWLVKLQDIFIELNLSLDMTQGEVAHNLRRLYEFYQNEVLMANVEKSIERLAPVESFLRTFREVWAETAKTVNQAYKQNGE